MCYIHYFLFSTTHSFTQQPLQRCFHPSTKPVLLKVGDDLPIPIYSKHLFLVLHLWQLILLPIPSCKLSFGFCNVILCYFFSSSSILMVSSLILLPSLIFKYKLSLKFCPYPSLPLHFHSSVISSIHVTELLSILPFPISLSVLSPCWTSSFERFTSFSNSVDSKPNYTSNSFNQFHLTNSLSLLFFTLHFLIICLCCYFLTFKF